MAKEDEQSDSPLVEVTIKVSRILLVFLFLDFD